MKNIIILTILFTSLCVNAQDYFCTGEKQEIELLQASVHSFHKINETNYQSDKYSIQELDSVSGDWIITVSKVYFNNYKPAGCRITKPETIYKNVKITKDGYYSIPVSMDEYTVMIVRENGVPKLNVFKNTILVK